MSLILNKENQCRKYRAIEHNDCVIILDENRCVNSFEKDIFTKYFEEENDKGI